MKEASKRNNLNNRRNNNCSLVNNSLLKKLMNINMHLKLKMMKLES